MSEAPVRVAVALGSNVGDRRALIHAAAGRLAAWLDGVVLSELFETVPVGVDAQPLFLNAAAVGWATRSLGDTFDGLMAIERDLGRERPFPGAPRTIDIDLILYGAEVAVGPGLLVPHPRFRERRFVLEPLASIAPDLIDPVTNLTVRQLLDQLPG